MPTCKICGKPVTTGIVVHAECLPQWVSVEDRLPETAQDVIVFDGRNVTFACKLGVWYGEFSRAINVTHWMPLPEPPKEVHDDEMD